jgi:hypothetical protein
MVILIQRSSLQKVSSKFTTKSFMRLAHGVEGHSGYNIVKGLNNGKESTVNRALGGSTYPG